MVSIVIATHGESAPALLASAEMIVGNVDNVHAITFLPGQGPDDLLDAYAAAVGDEPEVLFLVDLFGGSPYNAAARFVAERDGADVVAGVNIPMLMEVFQAAKRANATVETLTKKALKAGSSGVRAFKAGKPPVKKTPAQSAATTAGQEAPSKGEVDPNFPKDPNATMNVTFMRIDSRLIHGQVAGSWVNHVQLATLIAASDEAAGDSLRKQLLLQVGPASARTNVLDVAKTIRVYFNPDYTGMKTMIVVESPIDALRLIEGGVKVDELNVGGVTYKQGMTQVSEAVSVNDEHVAAYKKLHDLGVKMVLQQLPNSPRADMMAKLKEKGFA